jgi:hypothetical protein
MSQRQDDRSAAVEDDGRTALFVKLGDVAKLTGHDGNGATTDGGTLTNATRKQSLGDPD